MARKRTSVNAHIERFEKAAKLSALAERPGTAAEGQAAEAALKRMGATPGDVAFGKLAVSVRERKAALERQLAEVRQRNLAPKPKAPAAKPQQQPTPEPKKGPRHLTDATIRGLPTPAKGNKVYYYEVPGFGVRVTAGGARSFVLNYVARSGRERRYTIGQFPDWSTTAARAKARELRRDIDDGGDPLADIEAERAAPTVGELCDRFEGEHLPRKRESTQGDYGRMLRLYIRPALGHLKVADVAFADIDALHRKVTKQGHPYRANRLAAILSKMFSLAIRWGMRETNPAKGLEKNREYLRRRYLSADELARLIKALAEYPDQQTANIFRLLLLCGARRGEVLSMCWADLDLTTGIWSKPPSSTKQREHHQVPLSAPARQLLSEIRAAQIAKQRVLGTYVFPGNGTAGHIVEVKKGWRSLCKTAGITGLRIHDLRHSFASQLASGGASLPLIGALLGHSNPTTTHRYAHLFDDPQRAAVERVGAAISAAGKPAPEEPTPLRRGR
jgi:integrase